MALRIPLLVVAGPTASGKTEAAIRVARSVGGEIVSADSMQIYRGLDRGTAKPSAEERRAARFHLIDFVEPDQPYTVADFQRDARQAIREIWGRGSLPILCGGTGLYIRALLEHFDFPPAQDARQAQVRAGLEQELADGGSEALHRRLAAIDPQAAGRISLADGKRIVRALEVHELTGDPMSDLRRVDAFPTLQYNLAYCVLSRPRETLYDGTDRRVDAMLADGWLAEALELKARGLSPALPSLQAIGYRRLLAWLAETGSHADQAPADVVEDIKRDTRRFAKRQLTWFRRDRDAVWFAWNTRDQYGAVVGELCRRAGILLDAGQCSDPVRR